MRTLKKLLLAALALLLVLALALVANTWRQGSRQLEVAPLAALPVDEAAVAARLSEAIALPTVSSRDDASLNAQHFRQLHALLVAPLAPQRRHPGAQLRQMAVVVRAQKVGIGCPGVGAIVWRLLHLHTGVDGQQVTLAGHQVVAAAALKSGAEIVTTLSLTATTKPTLSARASTKSQSVQ